MSKEAVNSFLANIADDTEILSQIVGYASQQGHEFTLSELREELAGRLSEEALGGVAGGVLDLDKLQMKKKPAKK